MIGPRHSAARPNNARAKVSASGSNSSRGRGTASQDASPAAGSQRSAGLSPNDNGSRDTAVSQGSKSGRSDSEDVLPEGKKKTDTGKKKRRSLHGWIPMTNRAQPQATLAQTR